MTIGVGDCVKLSTTFVRSTGGIGRYVEQVGKVVKVVHDSPDWRLLEIEWQDGSLSSFNAKNLALLKEVAADARKIEHEGKVPGMIIGPGNAFAKFEDDK